MTERVPVHFDLETSDPDDVMTLAILATHPRVDLVGVTSYPGGPDQYGLIRHVLALLGRDDVPVGTTNYLRSKPSVSEFHDRWLGSHPEPGPHDHASIVIERSVFLGAVLLTGGPLKNPSDYASSSPAGRFFRRWVGQGGFAGDSVVPPEHRLAKFEGKQTCPTFNFNACIAGALSMLSEPRLEDRLLVSKNVCHGLAWDRAFHDRVLSLPRRTPGLDLVVRGMELYLQKEPRGKLLHDPLAAAVVIDESVCGFAPVSVYREGGEWGSRLWSGDGNPPSRISVSVDRERFFSVLTGS